MNSTTGTYYGHGESPHPSWVIQQRRDDWVASCVDPAGLLPTRVDDDALRAMLADMGEEPILPWDEEGEP